MSVVLRIVLSTHAPLSRFVPRPLLPVNFFSPKAGGCQMACGVGKGRRKKKGTDGDSLTRSGAPLSLSRLRVLRRKEKGAESANAPNLETRSTPPFSLLLSTFLPSLS